MPRRKRHSKARSARGRIAVRVLRGLLRESAQNWWDDNVPRLAAALAFYTTFSLAPMTFVVLAASTLIAKRSAVQAEILVWIATLIGTDGVRVVLTISQAAQREFPAGGATILALATMLVGATAVFVELQDALDTIWRVRPGSGTALRLQLQKRLVSFAIVLGIAFLLLVSVAVSAALSTAAAVLGSSAPVPLWLLRSLNLVVSLALVAGVFGLVYKLLPDTFVAWGDVWLGAVITSLMFTVGSSFIGLYLGGSSLRSLYGAAGSFVVVLIWVYYSALIFFFGAEFTCVYARRYGSKKESSEHAAAIELLSAPGGVAPP